MNSEWTEKLKKVKLIVMDVDGTLTNGRIILDDHGVETKHFHVKDGMGIRMAHEAGFMTAIITARQSRAVTLRAEELGITIVRQNVKNKAQALDEILQGLELTKEQAAYIGDDVNDIFAAQMAGICFAVQDASIELKKHADYVLNNKGGEGAVREAIEWILQHTDCY